MFDARPMEATTTSRRERLVAILDADPDLGALLSPERFAQARTELVARLCAPTGPTWRDHALDCAGPHGLGVLVLDGVVARELAMSDNVTTEFLGPGELLKSSGSLAAERLVRSEVRWTVLERPRLAVLGPQFAAAVLHYPEVNAVLFDRVVERSHRLAVAQAISQLNGVDRRILALLWHLAERWGRVAPDGVIMPLRLPHRLLAQAVGARRPTVSTALGMLAARESVLRLEDGSWLLRGPPVGLPTEESRRIVRLRQRRFQRDGSAPAAMN